MVRLKSSVWYFPYEKIQFWNDESWPHTHRKSLTARQKFIYVFPLVHFFSPCKTLQYVLHLVENILLLTWYNSKRRSSWILVWAPYQLNGAIHIFQNTLTILETRFFLMGRKTQEENTAIGMEQLISPFPK